MILPPVIAAVLAWTGLLLVGVAALHILAAAPGGVLSSIPPAFGAGLASLAFIVSVASALEIRLSLISVYAALALLLTVAILLRSRGASARVLGVARENRRESLRAGTRLLLAAVALTIGATLALSARDRLWWDGWAIWEAKARIMFLDGMLPRRLLGPGALDWIPHPEYPLALPALDWWVYRHAGAVAPWLASFTGAALFALLPLLGWSALRERVPQLWAAAAALACALFWPLSYYAAGGTADVLVALALLGAVLELPDALDGSRGAGVRAAVYLTLGALSKDEGLALAVLAVLVVAGVAALQSLPRAGGRRAAAAALPWFFLPLAASLPWFVYVWALGARPDVVSAARLARLAARLPVVLSGFGHQFAKRAWIPLPAIMLLGVAAAARRRGPLAAAWMLVGLYALAVLGVYLTAPQDAAWLIDNSLPRVLGAMVPAILCLTVLSVAQCPRANEPAGDGELQPAVRGGAHALVG